MEGVSDFYLFLISVIFISLSGVMAPGPLFAVTIAKSFKDKMAGGLDLLWAWSYRVSFDVFHLLRFQFSA
jgi:threonine/homoserine/homoserine lactone efflux protein